MPRCTYCKGTGCDPTQDEMTLVSDHIPCPKCDAGFVRGPIIVDPVFTKIKTILCEVSVDVYCFFGGLEIATGMGIVVPVKKVIETLEERFRVGDDHPHRGDAEMLEVYLQANELQMEDQQGIMIFNYKRHKS